MDTSQQKESDGVCMKSKEEGNALFAKEMKW